MKNIRWRVSVPVAACSVIAVVPPGMAEDLNVPADHATIQAAVDAAADGDTIHIAAGIYQEQVYIHTKNLTLIGQPGTILRAFPDMGPSGDGSVSQRRSMLFILESTDVTTRNITFEGDQLADQQEPNPGMVGAYYLDSGGAIEQCRFTGIREAAPGGMSAYAVFCLNDLPGAPLMDLRVADNVIEDSYIGMAVIGAPDTNSYNFVLENNTIRGVGPYPIDGSPGMRGIDLGQGITGSVVGNTISGFAYNGGEGATPYAWGIIAVGNGSPPNNYPLEPIRFEDNDLRDNNLHMMLLKAHDNQVLNNRFSGSGPTYRMAGLWFTGSNVVVRANEFRDIETGIRIGGEDTAVPGIGTDFGFAVNAVVTDNRFCVVATDIEEQPLSTAAVQGTVTCPFPPPPLEISLSWPIADVGFELESAQEAGGPWIPAAAPPAIQDGHYRVVLPADAPSQLFRLVR